ncbi:MAG: SHOCT domain-containing protein [Nevskiales bacterium]
MQPLTPAGNQAVQDLSQRYGISADAVRTMLFAVSAGGGTMAQFYHPELGGGGQWMRGGMTMVGDMFNHGLQATVNGLCSELSSLLGNQQVFLPPPAQSGGNGFMASGNSWWPGDLGSPSSSGGQNDARYAYFPQTRRLAISRNGQISVYDTLDHQIGGVQQQQGGYAGSLSFSSQFGTFTVDSLPMVSPAPQQMAPAPQPAPAPFYAPEPPLQPQPQPQPFTAAPAQGFGGASQSHDDILNAVERMAGLHQKGVLSDEEFKAKKAELLARL